MGFYEFIATRYFQVVINLTYMLLGIPFSVFLIVFPLYIVFLGFIPTETLAVSSANINEGPEIVDSGYTDSGVEIDVANYSIDFENAYEVSTDAAGSNDDSVDLTFELIWILA